MWNGTPAVGGRWCLGLAPLLPRSTWFAPAVTPSSLLLPASFLAGRGGFCTMSPGSGRTDRLLAAAAGVGLLSRFIVSGPNSVCLIPVTTLARCPALGGARLPRPESLCVRPVAVFSGMSSASTLLSTLSVPSATGKVPAYEPRGGFCPVGSLRALSTSRVDVPDLVILQCREDLHLARAPCGTPQRQPRTCRPPQV